MYLSLYRKYRPTTFDEMIGQEHITTILKNQIKTGKTGHAYLFAGTRGTGKTSAAKILARAVNCEKPKDGNPCNVCETCKTLLSPANVDVVEIDAASNNRVDEIREIREKVQFTPVSARFKVYIIDEVHMLTDSAFNALLKTLEEPPAHAMFILATTEAHKLPATILSRCMRFDFKLIGADKLEELLTTIFKEQKKKYEPEALTLIAAAGEGSARDALSIADMCINYGDTLKYADVLNVLGATDFDTLSALAQGILAGDIGELFTKVDSLIKAGKSVGVLAKDLLKHFRDLLIIKACKDASKLLAVPKDIFAKMKKSAENADKEAMLSVIENLSSIEQDLRYSVQPRIVLETAMLRIVSSAQASIASLPDSGSATTPEAKQAGAKPTTGKSASQLWGHLVKQLRESGNAVLYAACANITGNTVSGNDYIIHANTTAEEALLSRPENLDILKNLLGGYNIVIRLAAGGKKPAEDDLKKLENFVGKDKLKIE